jgi:nucleoside-diphosphate-sugar epimerase
MAQKKILVTGMSGLIGGVVRRRLEGRYDLSALNRSDVPGVPCHRADVADLEAILPAFAGQDTVVHLAAIARGNATWEEVLSANVIGTYNVFEASRREGVKRIIYASSGATISGWEHEMPYQALVDGHYDEVAGNWHQLTRETPVRPSGIYGCSKVWGEALARHFTDTSDLSILCVRIGAVNRDDRPQQSRGFSVWCSQGDIAQMIERCVEAPPDLRFDIFYALSNNRWGYRDLEHARDVLGFVPEDAAEEHRGG